MDVVVQPITTDFWPPAMSSAIPRIIGLLDDSSVTLSQTAGELNFYSSATSSAAQSRDAFWELSISTSL